MMKKFQNKYRIQSHRRPNWDYSTNGFYFITFVTQHRECLLGEIRNEEMHLSDFGKIVQDEWLNSFELRNELFMDEYVIMPNHIHGIIVLEKINIDEKMDCRDTRHGRDTRPCVSTSNNPPTTKSTEPPIRLPKSVSSFIGGFKSAVNTKIDNYIDENHLKIRKYNRFNHFFQPNYHDRIIRNATELGNIRNYIVNNPLNWNNDELR